MKKIIPLAFLFLGLISVSAQRNSVFLATDFGFHRLTGFSDNKMSLFTFSPIVAYEVADNWFIGVKSELSYGENSGHSRISNVDYKIKTKDYSTRMGGFVRYYHAFNETFGIYGDLGAGYLRYRSNQNALNFNTGNTTFIDAARIREYGYYIDFVPALFVNFKNNFGLNISLGGIEWSDVSQNQARDYDNYKTTREFDITFGKAIKVGVSKKLVF